MAKPIAPKPEKGPLETAMDGKLPKERSRLKANALRDAAAMSFTLDGVAVALRQPPNVDSRGVLQVVLDASGPGFANVPKQYPDGSLVQPFEFANPPVKVPDGTARIEKNQRGEDVEVDNFAEDVDAVFQRVVVDAVLASKARW